MAGEQFALPEAVGQLRAIRRAEPTGDLFGISGADPLNLTGIVTPGDRVPALAVNRIVFRDGVPIAAREAGEFRILHSFDPTLRHDVERALVRKRVSPALTDILECEDPTSSPSLVGYTPARDGDSAGTRIGGV
jgi:ATP-dependent Lhr-like helicase